MSDEIELDNVYYFSVKKRQHPEVFNLVQNVIEDSNQHSGDKLEIQRRLRLLTTSEGNEHLRQCSNFLAEALAFAEIHNKGQTPHWVPVTSLPTPDIKYEASGMFQPVEVKHLNSPREEHEALASGMMYGGSVNMDYDAGLVRKINDFIVSAKSKFLQFNASVNETESEKGTLYLYFSKSIDAGLTDGIEWQKTMKERIADIATPLCGDEVNLIIEDINE